ncbi:hypothetical protein A6A04_04925 [Paramagnetospirillum marisnigri]|uniref:Uncharacterized protein n=2 Tax=Paramagnetospirillum marisnigri TaxID=1285242 RepID=A0A178MHC4_9PROT|nr:hypothetical protein A6A04_04925 [Paramagnetospirillum marisnigri]
MGSLRDLNQMSRDFGLGNRYFLLVGAILAALLTALFVWGHSDAMTDAPPPVPASPAASTPSSY